MGKMDNIFVGIMNIAVDLPFMNNHLQIMLSYIKMCCLFILFVKLISVPGNSVVVLLLLT